MTLLTAVSLIIIGIILIKKANRMQQKYIYVNYFKLSHEQISFCIGCLMDVEQRGKKYFVKVPKEHYKTLKSI